MDWSNEEYVKVYRRETDDDLILTWQARALWGAMMIKFDRSGLLETRRGVRGLAALVRIPLDVVETVLPELLEDGRVLEVPVGYFSPNFIAAQEASKSDKLRQRESRQRRAAFARRSIVLLPDVTNRDGAITERDSESRHDVTNRDQTSRDVTASHAASHGVTLSSADPDPDPDPEDLPPAGAIPPSTEQAAAAVLLGAELPARQRAQRRELQLELRGVLERARADVAAELGLEARPLLAQDPGERVLAMRLVDAGEQLATARDEALHAIAIAAAEARRDRSVQWLTGAIFEERTFRRLVGMTLEDAARPRAGPRSSAERAPTSPEPIRKIKTL